MDLPGARRTVVIAAVLLAVLVATPASGGAGGASTRHGRAEGRRMFPGLSDLDLNLTEEQEERIAGLLEMQGRLLKMILENSGLSREQKREQVREVRERYRRKMNDLLDEQQQGKLAAMLQRIRERSGEPGANMMERVAVRLRLTEEQQETFRALVESQAEAMRQVLQDQSLSTEEKAAAIRELREKNRQAIDSILSPEQKEIHDEIRNRIRNRYREEHTHDRPDQRGRPLQRRGERPPASN